MIFATFYARQVIYTVALLFLYYPDMRGSLDGGHPLKVLLYRSVHYRSPLVPAQA